MLLLCVKVKDPRLYWRQEDLYRVEIAVGVGVLLGRDLLNESTCKDVHDSGLLLALFTIEQNIIAV